MLGLLFCSTKLITGMSLHIHIKKELRFNDYPNSFIITIVYLFSFNVT